MVEISVTRFPSVITPFLRMLAHFDSLDGDADPPVPMARYELLHPEDSYPAIPDFAAHYEQKLWEEMLYGTSV